MRPKTMTVLAFLFSQACAFAFAEEQPEVEFHSAAYAFPSLDKTPGEFATANPELKLLEVVIRVSATFNVADGEVDRIEYRLKMPDTFEILDYLPKTSVGSELAGTIDLKRRQAENALTVVSLEGGARAGFKIPTVADAGVDIRVGQGTTNAKELGSSIEMSLLPPKQLVTSASTQNAGRTLHFKLKKFNQITLEGDKDFAFLVAVPKGWKGDCFALECAAVVNNVLIQKTLTLGLYPSGDLAAKRRLETLAKSSDAAIKRTLNHNAKVETTTAKIETTPEAKKSETVQLQGRNRFITVDNSFVKQGIDATYYRDGTWEGWLQNINSNGDWKSFGSSRVRGTWAIDGDKVSIKQTQSSIFGASSWINDPAQHANEDPITSSDVEKGIVKLKSGKIITQVR